MVQDENIPPSNTTTTGSYYPNDTTWVSSIYQAPPTNEQNVREVAVRFVMENITIDTVDQIIDDANKIANFILNGK